MCSAADREVLKNIPGTISWSIAIPLFRGVVFRQLGLAIGIPFGILIIILLIIARSDPNAFYGLGLIIALLFFTWLFLMVVYRGKYDAEFILDEKGALYQTEVKQAKKNRIVNSLAVLLGLFTGKPVAIGAGMLAGSRQKVFLRWDCLTESVQTKSYTILLRAGLTNNIGLLCQDNYYPVEQFVRHKTKHLQGN